VEHLTLAVSVWRVNTVEKQVMEVWIAPEVAGGAMNGGDRAALAAGKSAVSLALAIPPGHSVGEDAQDLARCLHEMEFSARGLWKLLGSRRGPRYLPNSRQSRSARWRLSAGASGKRL